MSPEPLPPLRASFKRAAALGDTPGFIGDIGGDVGGVLSGEKSGPPPPPLPLPLLLRGVLVGLPSPLTVPALILALLLLVDLTPLCIASDSLSSMHCDLALPIAYLPLYEMRHV